MGPSPDQDDLRKGLWDRPASDHAAREQSRKFQNIRSFSKAGLEVDGRDDGEKDGEEDKAKADSRTPEQSPEWPRTFEKSWKPAAHIPEHSR